MNTSNAARIALALSAFLMLSACANTIRGMGRDTANTVNATQSAGNDVNRAAQ